MKVYESQTEAEMSAPSIRIISTPPGDAPLWVREKWVGLNLPIVGNNSRRALSFSILIKPALLNHLWAMLCGRFETIVGYRVEAHRAIDILAVSSPEAAQWWRQNAPGFFRARRFFIFHAEACQLNPD